MNMRMPTLKKRIDVIWIAAALIAGTGGAVLATASSSAGEDPQAAVATGSGPQMTAATDPRLASDDPGDGEEIAKLAVVAGAPPHSPPQTWDVGGRTVLGYTTANGRFCFEFRGLAGGCLGAGVLTDEQPVDVFLDHGPRLFNVYGLAADGVVGVTVRVGDKSQAAAFAHNSFFFSDAGLGSTSETTGEVTVNMSDGTTRTQSFRISSLEAPLTSP
jgi:hypothetical protein